MASGPRLSGGRGQSESRGSRPIESARDRLVAARPPTFRTMIRYQTVGWTWLLTPTVRSESFPNGELWR